MKISKNANSEPATEIMSCGVMSLSLVGFWVADYDKRVSEPPSRQD